MFVAQRAFNGRKEKKDKTSTYSKTRAKTPESCYI